MKHRACGQAVCPVSGLAAGGGQLRGAGKQPGDRKIVAVHVLPNLLESRFRGAQLDGDAQPQVGKLVSDNAQQIVVPPRALRIDAR